MTRSLQIITEKSVLVILFCAVTITVIGYQRLYWRVHEQCGITVKDLTVVNGNFHKREDFVDKVAVDVYYESLCSDSRSFVIDQLMPAVRLLGDRISLKMIPYGKTETLSDNGKTKFQCQHGPRECLGNKYHSCIVDRTSGNVSLQVGVVGCVFDSLFTPMDSAVMKCCRRFGLNFRDIKTCVVGREGTDLLKIHGSATEPLHVLFVPTVVLNRVFGGEDYQNKILKDLKAEVCKIINYNAADRKIDEVCSKKLDSESEQNLFARG